MKIFMKYFIVALIVFTVIFTGVLNWYSQMNTSAEPLPVDKSEDPDDLEPEGPYQKYFDESERINFLVLGMEETRTDTIMMASFDPENKKVDLISVPRDTYYSRNENHSADLKKINAVYGGEGVEGVQKAVSDILWGMPIHHYVKVDYSGVANVVDSLGGVDIYIPMDMDYDDVWDEEPLHIQFEKGQYTLKGEDAVKFLRFRKNNDGTGYPDGDIGRIRAQQNFVRSAFGKALGYKLPTVANTVVRYVKTDLPAVEAGKLALSAIGMETSDLTTYSLPGEAVYTHGVSYYWHDEERTSHIVEELYGVDSATEAD